MHLHYLVLPCFTRRRLMAASCLAATATVGLAAPAGASGLGVLLVTGSHYAGDATTITVGRPLPNSSGAVAIANGSYPYVFANKAVDPNFGVTAPIVLSAFATLATNLFGVVVGEHVGDVDVTALTGVSTSFSSKSELALNLSTDQTSLTLMGYGSPINVLDVSNSNTPGHVDPTNTDTQAATNRDVLELGIENGVRITPVSAYGGDNGRAAILARDISGSGHDAYLMVGNAGNGSGIEPASMVRGSGVQLIVPGATNGTTTVIGQQQGTPGARDGFQYGFSVTSLGDAADKSGKDNNFRGETVYDNQLYVSKGSGSSGVNSVYKVTSAADPLQPGKAQIAILPGFPTGLAKDINTADKATEFYPFGVWFANRATLYVADEGAPSLANDPHAGLQKWMLRGKKWVLAYTLRNGLNLDKTYRVANYPVAVAPATTGLRNITGSLDGSAVTIFATTATFSANTDPGADPNQVVQIVDQLGATTMPFFERFQTVQSPAYGTVYRGVAYAECSNIPGCVVPTHLVGR